MTLQNRINPQGLFNEKVCESALFHQKNESYPQRGAENAQKDAVASKVYLTFDATAPFSVITIFGLQVHDVDNFYKSRKGGSCFE